MERVLYFDGHRAYWAFPGGDVFRTRVADPGRYVFTDEGVQLFTKGWQGLPLTWPDDLTAAGDYLAEKLGAGLVADQAEFHDRAGRVKR